MFTEDWKGYNRVFRGWRLTVWWKTHNASFIIGWKFGMRFWSIDPPAWCFCLSWFFNWKCYVLRNGIQLFVSPHKNEKTIDSTIFWLEFNRDQFLEMQLDIVNCWICLCGHRIYHRCTIIWWSAMHQFFGVALEDLITRFSMKNPHGGI